MARRILLFVTDLEIGGTPTVVREVATRLHQPGAVEVEVACLKRAGPVAEQIRAGGIGVTAFELSSVLQLPRAVKRLRQLVRERGMDTVFSFLVHANTVAAIASRGLPGVRFLQSIQTTQRKPAWHWWVQGAVAGAAEKIVGPSRAVGRVARERSGISADAFVVIPNAVDLADFERHEVFSAPTIRLGFIGRLDPVKNIPALISAVRWNRDLPLRCNIFGEGVERPHLQWLIDEQRLGDRVFLRGAVARPQEALAQMDVLVLPSVGEGFGLVLIEAMAAGVPVIAAKRGAIAEVVQDGVNGLLVEGDELDREIARRVRRLRDDPQLRSRVIEGGLRTVGEKYNWDVVLPQYRRLLELW